MEAELQAKFGDKVEVSLIPGSGGVFEVVADGAAIFSKKALGRFPEAGEIVNSLRE